MRLLISLLLLTVTLGACANGDNEPRAGYSHTIHTMGTVVTLTLYDTPPARARQTSRDIETRLNEFSARWWSWGEGDLGQINQQLQQGRPASVPPDMQTGLRRAIALSERTDGRFNPALGRLTELWGMHDPGSRTTPPTAVAIEALLPIPPAASLIPHDQDITPPEPLILDSGGFAKGLAVAETLRELRSRGVERAIVDAGGDLGLLGQPGDTPWRIGVRDPSDGVIARLELPEADLAVFSSGDYERGYEHKGARYHHILDPLSGRPVTHTRAVTVVHPDALVADIAATAILVAGPGEWLKTARELGVERVLRVDADGTLHATRAMAEVLFMEPDTSNMVIHESPPGG